VAQERRVEIVFRDLECHVELGILVGLFDLANHQRLELLQVDGAVLVGVDLGDLPPQDM
jgi:hypothetical protein